MSMLLIPLAGEGKRFKEAGYTVPKPLIKVEGVPMVIKAAQALPEADVRVFLCRKEHIAKYRIGQKIKQYFPQAKILEVPALTEGEASTCLLAEQTVDRDSLLTIGSCDVAALFNHGALDALIASNEIDALIWTFRNNPCVQAKPEVYAWVSVDDAGYAQKVSTKIPISDTPIQDHAVVGTFTFKRASYFFDYAKNMIRENRRINKEFYVDECMNLLIEDGLRVKVFEVDVFLCFGTPVDLQMYEYWREYFNTVKS